jgi:hypothetical protein
MQDRYMVCAEHTIGSILTHPMDLLGDMGHVESCFGPLEDEDRCMVCVKHTTWLETILDAPDGTAR